MWIGCHDVSMMEDVPIATGGHRLNFLSNDGLMPYQDLSSTTYTLLSPWAVGTTVKSHTNAFTSANVKYNLSSASYPIMQFMGEIQDAMNGNSEHVFVPFKAVPGYSGGWRDSTTTAIYDPSQVDVPTKSPGPAAIAAYGRAYGNPDNGLVLYQGSHIDQKNSGDDAEWVGERRMFGNFLLMAVLQ